MPRMSAVHSTRDADPKVYHDNSDCTEWNNIEQRNLAKGTANRPLCKHCADLNRAGK